MYLNSAFITSSSAHVTSIMRSKHIIPFYLYYVNNLFHINVDKFSKRKYIGLLFFENLSTPKEFATLWNAKE